MKVMADEKRIDVLKESERLKDRVEGIAQEMQDPEFIRAGEGPQQPSGRWGFDYRDRRGRRGSDGEEQEMRIIPMVPEETRYDKIAEDKGRT